MQKNYRPENQLRCLIYGVSGTGKTYSLRTARRPVHIDSFDPNGTQSVDDCVAEGWLFADTRFELEDPQKPDKWLLWGNELRRRSQAGYFDRIGTYATDLTMLSSAAMNQVLKEANRVGGIPQQNDYLPQMTKIENAIKFLLTLPCDVVLLAHVNVIKDEVSGRLSYSPLVTGKLVVRIPLLFSEIWVAQTKETAKGLAYTFMTQAAGNYVARTRLGKGGRFEKYEEPNFKALLKKAGKNAEDLLY